MKFCGPNSSPRIQEIQNLGLSVCLGAMPCRGLLQNDLTQTVSSDIFGGILPFIDGDSSSPDEYEVQSFAAASTVIGTHHCSHN